MKCGHCYNGILSSCSSLLNPLLGSSVFYVIMVYVTCFFSNAARPPAIHDCYTLKWILVFSYADVITFYSSGKFPEKSLDFSA